MENGFGYGVVGADMHVFGNGTPVYLLEHWRTTRASDRDWLRELPSRMLNARHEVVDFTGREAELAQLNQWRQGGPRLAARWLHGPGGQGKTRLAARFAAQCAADGWAVVTAVHGPGTVLPPPGSQDMRLRHARGVLIIVDYADRWPLSHLTWLFSNALLHRDVPARVLLLARTDALWPAVRATLANHEAGTSSQLLEALAADDLAQRTRMYIVARDSFAATYGIRDASGVHAPGPLEHEDFGLTLAIHMAALVAVDAEVTGRRPPQDMAGLTVYLLDREHLHWENLYGHESHELEPGERAYATPPGVMNQAVFTATLAGPQPRPLGTSLLEALPIEGSPETILADHALCYPPTDPTGKTVLEPLYPDRLAEDFLALTLPGHEADYPAQPWAEKIAYCLADRIGESVAVWTPRAITFLATAAVRWPHVGLQYLYPILYNHPRLALIAGSAALSALADIPTVDPVILHAVEKEFPERDVDLDIGMAAVTERLAHFHLDRTDDDATRAGIYSHLGIRLGDAGRFDEAVSVHQEAVSLRRRLVEEDAAAHQQALASALNNLGVALARAGRRAEALPVAEEAVTLRRGSAVDDAKEHDLGLATALTNLSSKKAEMGRWAEALVAAEEAVAIHRRYAPPDSDADELAFAEALHNLGPALLKAERREEALQVMEEAVASNRRLAQTAPATYAPALAHGLANLGACLSSLGRWTEALRAAEESVAIRRRNVESNPEAHEPDLAESLQNLGVDLARVGRQAEALAASEESVSVYRRLVLADPAAHEPALARSLRNMGAHLAALGRSQEALRASKESSPSGVDWLRPIRPPMKPSSRNRCTTSPRTCPCWVAPPKPWPQVRKQLPSDRNLSPAIPPSSSLSLLARCPCWDSNWQVRASISRRCS